ncbi:MAG: PepSY-associated TM helix domain-containing protein [Hyphomicrobium sp.]|uniref:PepSY-associated TM helix domain-containing protein n=1 Tax=Hyphomicrobium sp. TaxID=82 RepID=UPI00356209F4
MRYLLVLVHRWVGLSIAGFLVLAGATGAVISWDHELDELLNPHLIFAPTVGSPQSALTLKDSVESRDPRRQVTYLPIATEPGHSLQMYMEGRPDPQTGAPYELGYNQLFVDPVSGNELGSRNWGAAWPITRETLVSFLYKLHYTLHLPPMWGVQDWGTWLMGGVALLWTLDSFVGFYLTLPTARKSGHVRAPAVARRLARGWWSRWRPAWIVKTTGTGYRIAVDIHRALGLWAWCALLVMAFTGFSLSLFRPVFLPVVELISTTTPSPIAVRAPVPATQRTRTLVDFARILQLASANQDESGITAPVGAIGYIRDFATYRVSYFRPGEEHGTGGAGVPETYWDASNGAYLGMTTPWSGTAADLFVQSQLPVHSGRILGVPGRIIISLMGALVAVLATTGVLIWWRKYKARSLRDARRVSAEGTHAAG